jgi:hypothetical protein
MVIRRTRRTRPTRTGTRPTPRKPISSRKVAPTESQRKARPATRRLRIKNKTEHFQKLINSPGPVKTNPVIPVPKKKTVKKPTLHKPKPQFKTKQQVLSKLLERKAQLESKLAVAYRRNSRNQITSLSRQLVVIRNKIRHL